MSARLDHDPLLPRTFGEWRTFVREGWRELLFLAGASVCVWLWARALSRIFT